ncbi:hypothetical protein MauCBS54593_007602 [Microsporum audouinii]
MNSVRNFSSTASRKLLKLLGKVTLEDVKKVNGADGINWVSSVGVVRDAVETQYPIVTNYQIQGAKAHKSSSDPSDPENVLTLGFFSQNGTRILSGHVHLSGTFKLAESRAGKKKGK